MPQIKTPYKILILLVSFCCLLFLFDWLRFYYNPLISSSSPILYEFKPGMSVSQMAWELNASGAIKRPRYFIFLSKLSRVNHKLRAGEYLFAIDASPRAILRQIAEGKVFFRFVTMIEGWTFKQIKEALANNPFIAQHMVAMSPEQVLKTLHITAKSAEGQFYPDTYKFEKGNSDLQILRQAHRLMTDKLANAWQRRYVSIPLTDPYQALIIASIIEKETAVAAEKPLVASVIYNRLRKKMRLQVDPTVIYGLGLNYQGKINKADLGKDTPYNTYLYAGLPPTPIAMPSESSLNAAVQPILSDFLYFVAKGDGSHEFSVTLDQQNAAVNKYLHRNKAEKHKG